VLLQPGSVSYRYYKFESPEMSKFSTRRVSVMPKFHLRHVSLYFITV